MGGALHYLHVRASVFICQKKGLNQFQAKIFASDNLHALENTTKPRTIQQDIVAEKNKRDDNYTLTARQ